MAWPRLVGLALCLAAGASASVPLAYGRTQRQLMEETRLHATLVFRDLARQSEQPPQWRGWSRDGEEGLCDPRLDRLLGRNGTWRLAYEALDRCADPLYAGIRVISHAQIQWQRVYRPPPPPPKPKTKKATEMEVKGGNGADGTEGPEGGKRRRRKRAAGAAASLEDGDEEERQSKDFMVFLLTLPRDYYSHELEALVAAVAPCFPRVLFLQGDATQFHDLVSQLGLKSLPKLLLFEDSLLKTRFSGPRTLANMLAFLTAHTGRLPQAIPPFLPPLALLDDRSDAYVQTVDTWALLPPEPIPPPRLGPVYWLSWLVLLGQALGPWMLRRWRQRQRQRQPGGSSGDNDHNNGTDDHDGRARQ